jgi:hypothetical protein
MNQGRILKEQFRAFAEWWKKEGNTQAKLSEILAKGQIIISTPSISQIINQDDFQFDQDRLSIAISFLKEKYPNYFNNKKTNNYPHICGVYACFFIKAYDRKIGYAFLLIKPNTDIETNSIFSFDVELKSNYKPSIGLGLKQNDNLFLLFNDPRDKRVITNGIKNNPEQLIFNLGKDFENVDDHVTEMMALFSGTTSSNRNPVGRDFYCVYCRDMNLETLENIKIEDSLDLFNELKTNKVTDYFAKSENRIIEVKDWEMNMI